MWPFRRAPPPQPLAEAPIAVRLTVVNDRSSPVTLGLEPLGYFFDVAPGRSQGAEFAPNGPDQPHLEITLHEDGLDLWEESGDGQGLSPEGGHFGSNGPA